METKVVHCKHYDPQKGQRLPSCPKQRTQSHPKRCLGVWNVCENYEE